MEQNPFAAPKAEIDVRLAGAVSDGPWFAVGTRKLLVMSVLTFGLYTIHWFERHYRFQKAARREDTMPLARGLFSIFFAKDLFWRVEVAAQEAQVRHGWAANSMAAMFVVCVLANRIVDRVSGKIDVGTTSAILTLASTALLCGLAYPLVRVQGTLNEVMDRNNPSRDRNETFTPWNWLLMLVGGGLLFMAVVGSFLPDK